MNTHLYADSSWLKRCLLLDAQLVQQATLQGDGDKNAYKQTGTRTYKMHRAQYCYVIPLYPKS
jgi:hypothetical protein